VVDKWEKMRQRYVEIYWSHLPGFRLAGAEEQQLFDDVSIPSRSGARIHPGRWTP
jgi:hypothetical protein